MVFTAVLSVGSGAENLGSGKSIYNKFCVKCHGPKGKGDGSVADSLKIPPADLTMLSLKNNNRFPMEYVIKTIMGSDNSKGHGTSDMPVWGKVFANAGYDEEDIQDLAFYVKSLQVAGE